jgi:outer membrane receptor for ferrienterochelin and colicins
LTGGLRYDDHDAFGGRLTPRLYAVWNPTSEFTLKGGVGQGYKASFLEQLYDGVVGCGNQGQDPLYGNPNLDPETSTNDEISGIFNSPVGFFAQMTLFYTEISDKIERPTAASGVTDEFANIGEARVQGLEFVASDQIARGFDVFNLGGSYSVTDKVSINAVIYNLVNRNFNDYRPYPLRNNPDVIAYSNVYNNIYKPRQLWVLLNVDF